MKLLETIGIAKISKRHGILILALLIPLFLLFRLQGLPHCSELELWIQRQGFWGPVVFVLVYILSTLLFAPGTPLSLVAGIVFGPWWGTLLISIGATLGAYGAFFISRHVAGEWATETLRKKEWFSKFQGNFEKNSLSYLFFLRLSPIFPFNGLNYACGLFPISFRDYALSTAIGMIPGTAAYVYTGNVLGCSFLDGKNALAPEIRGRLFLGLLALSFLSLLPALWKRKR